MNYDKIIENKIDYDVIIGSGLRVSSWCHGPTGPTLPVISGLNWTIANSHRTEMGCSIGTLEMRTLSPSGNSKDTRNETTI
jgi:hypothetical protein